jgi:hypothetical protein
MSTVRSRELCGASLAWIELVWTRVWTRVWTSD